MSAGPLLQLLRWSGCVLAWVLGFALVGSALAAWAPLPNVPVVGDKLEYLRAHRGDFDTVFVGSSRVHSQIIPAIFDKVAGTRSFNLGVPAMMPPESLYVARCVLGLRLPRLKRMFIELADLDPVVDMRNASSSRGAYWHDVRHTWMACRESWQSSRPAMRKLAMIADHLRIFVDHLANAGRGAAIVATCFSPRPRKEKGPRATGDGGFLPVKTTLTDAQLRRIHESHEETRSRDWPEIPLRPSYRDALRKLIGDSRRAGVEPVFFIAPSFNWRDRLTGPEGVKLFTFRDEARFPALFDPQHYGDTVHLNVPGAVLFTTALAEEFSAAR